MRHVTRQQRSVMIEQLEDRVALSVSPGLLGYEGQPGNQGGGSHQGNGQLGYEGQPGNQSGSQGTPNGLKGYEGQPGNQGG